MALTVNKVALEASLCRDSFYDFFLRFWPDLVPEKLNDNWHIRFLCDEVQRVAERVFRREPKEYDLIINVPPGSTKSTIVSEMLPAWCWTRDPSLRMICGSYGYGLSNFLASQTRRILQSERYQTLFPQVQLTAEGKEMMETSRGGQRIGTSPEGRITGLHAHLILVDDPLNPREAASEVTLNTANLWFDETLMSRMVHKAITPLILVMQRLHQNDPSGHRLDKASNGKGVPVRHLCLPAEMDDNVRPRSLRKKYVDGLFDPNRLSRDILEDIKKDGEYVYSGQYQQRPVPRGGGMIKVDMIDIQPKPSRMIRTVRYWDKAGTGGKGCYTVGVKIGLDVDRNYWILDVVRGQWEAAERERIIKQTAVMDSKDVLIGVEQEGGSGGKESAQNTVKNLAGFRVKLDAPKGDKVLRADPFASQVNAGGVKMIQAPWNKAYLDELRFFPFSTYKDQVDATSGGFATLTGIRYRVGGLTPSKGSNEELMQRTAKLRKMREAREDLLRKRVRDLTTRKAVVEAVPTA